MGIPFNGPYSAFRHWRGKHTVNVVWAAFAGALQCSAERQGTDHLSDRDRRDIGITRQDIAVKFDREMAKLDTTLIR